MRNVLVLGLVAITLVGMALPATAQDETADDEPRNFETYLSEAHSWGSLGIHVGPDFVAIDWSGITLGENASSDLRHLADGAISGDKDGQVDESELDDFTFGLSAIFQNTFGKFANNHAFSGFVLIDQAEAQGVEVTGVDADGLTGDVDQGGLVTVGIQLRIAFPNVDDYRDVHTVRFDLGSYFIQEGNEEEADRLAGDLTLTVDGADGWTIDGASVNPQCAADSFQDGRLVFEGDDVACFTGHDGVLLSFAINGDGQREKNFLPGFEAAFVALALVGVVALRRRL